MQVLDAVKLVLDIHTDEHDAVLQLMVEDATAAVRDYCNRKDCPDELDYVVRELVVNSFQENNSDNVASVSRGDTQISYRDPISREAFTARQMAAMNRYRKTIIK